jgi:acyl-CoA synthetase (AMP-forming)/AMP-acid ligase II
VFAAFADDRVALVDAAGGHAISYLRLAEATRANGEAFAGPKSIVFLFLRNTIDSIVAYLAALDAGHAIALLDHEMKREFALELVETYRPEYVYLDAPDQHAPPSGYQPVSARLFRLERSTDVAPHPDLTVLLSTSGSTGSPKFVRLSRENVADNAGAIARSLRIKRADRAITNLPLHYSYGMSLLNSHLIAGASVVVSDASVVEPRFWDALKAHEVTSLAGVPYTYQMLERVGFAAMDLPMLRKMTQAGGKMHEPVVRRFHDLLAAKGAELYVMYGQTEASPRISCVPPERLAEKIGSAGVALPGGTLAIRTSAGTTTAADVEGEVTYTGRNVMMGYAHGRSDSALGDTQGDTLYTGDLGHLDGDQFLYLAGRSTRISKLFGLRVSLGDAERMVCGLGPVAAVAGADRLHVYHEAIEATLAATTRKQLARDLQVPVQAIVFHALDRLPTMSNGKVDYRALEAMPGNHP